jgi:hypothetical protein
MRRPVKYGLSFCGMVLGLSCTWAHAQGMSPVMQEFNKKVRGAVQVTNIGDSPKIVSCRAQSFDADKHGTLQLRPIDSTLHVRLDNGRTMVAAKSSRQVSFDATPGALPAWFVVTCRFMPVEQGPGLTLAMEISSIVIVHGGTLDSRDVSVSAKRMGSKVQVEVKNNGSGLARVSSGEVIGHRKQADMGTFILFPHQERLVEADWKEMNPPETVRIQIGSKRLEAPVK